MLQVDALSKILTETFAIEIQNWFDKKRIDFGVFLLECASFRLLHIGMDWNLQEVLNCVSFLMTSSLFDD